MSANPAQLADLSQLQVDPTSYDPSSLIVRLRSETESFSLNASVVGPTPATDTVPLGFGLQKVELMQGVSVDSVLGAYRNDANVLYAEPDYDVQIATIPNDPQFSDQWGLHNTGQLSGTVDADIDAPDAWDLSTGNGSTVVAVIDTGVDYAHPDLASNMWTNPGEIPGDGLDNDNNGYVDDVHGYDFFNGDGDPRDDNNHGTHVAGTIAAEGNDGTGVAGINWDAQIMALKFLGADGSGSTSDAIASVRYAVENGAQISNNSWGGDPYSQALYDAIVEARDEGHLFVAASGNGNSFGIGQDNDATPFYPASFDLDNIVAVAATDRNDQIATFSNYGNTSVDVGAPGVDILSTQINGGYGTSSGTSMAAPHVAGALSLLRDFDPTLTYQQLIDRVLLSVDPADSLEGLTVTGGRLNLAGAMVPDTFGPRIADVQPSGQILDPFDRLRISFNEPIDATTFTLEDVDRFSGPQGEIAVTSLEPVAGSNGRQFELTFPTQSAAGTYELDILPEILDRFGNPMDQNDNGTGGEVPEDVFTHEFVKENAVARFDFGTSSSPLAADYTPVVGGDRYGEALGYGWQTTGVYSIDRSGDDLTRDVNYTQDSTFAIDLPNGEYDVIATMGEMLTAHDQMGVYLEGVQVDSVTTAGSQFAVNTYRTSVTDGQLNLGLRDLGGSNPYAVINGLDVVFAGPDLTGPSVASVTPSGTDTGPIDRFGLTFSEPIDETTFTLDDVVTLEGPAGAIAPIAVNALGAGEFEVVFESQNVAGDYRLIVGPEISDIAGNLMDQNGNGIDGETLEDRFESTLTLEAGPEYVARFDFGTSSSPVATDYMRIAGGDRYSQSVGYGWQSFGVYSVNRSGDALTRDLNYTQDSTFEIDLPNGEYDVTATMGEMLVPHDQMGLFLEGVQVDSVTTDANQFAVNTYRTSVTDGQLNLRLRDLGGSNPYAVINALDVVFAGPDLTGPSVVASKPNDTVTGPIDRFELTFSEPIDETTFTLDDVVSLDGPAGAIVPTAVNGLGAGEFEVVFEPQNVSGDYHLVVGPEITDMAGNPMDQNENGSGGEVPDDRFEAIVTLEAGPQYVARFDFGTPSSPVATNYTRVVGGDRYSDSTGYGWHSGWAYSLSRSGDDLTRDVNYTTSATFGIDLPNGEYDVTVTMGEKLIAHDQMGVFLEGVQVDSVTTAASQFAVNTYRTDVADGQLSLTLVDLGGSDPYVMINGLDVVALDAASATSLIDASMTSALSGDGVNDDPQWDDWRSTLPDEEIGPRGHPASTTARPYESRRSGQFDVSGENSPSAISEPSRLDATTVDRLLEDDRLWDSIRVSH